MLNDQCSVNTLRALSADERLLASADREGTIHTDLTVQILDPNAAASNHKFYRAVAP